jgi:hypothetical protein
MINLDRIRGDGRANTDAAERRNRTIGVRIAL